MFDFILKDLVDEKNTLNLELLNTDTKQIHKETCENVLFFYGLNKKLGPLLEWGLDNDGKKINVTTEAYETNKSGIFAVGDINDYPGKMNLILSGFHETTLAVQKAYKRIFPGERVPFGYTTSSTQLHEKLGVNHKEK